jgi:hypothetical protein
MLAPNAISFGLAFKKSASTLRAKSMITSVSSLVGYAQWVLALWW